MEKMPENWAGEIFFRVGKKAVFALVLVSEWFEGRVKSIQDCSAFFTKHESQKK